MPIPPATSSTRERVRRAPVSAPYGPSMSTPACRPQLLEAVRVVAEILDRDPQPRAVGRGRDRERMAPPPTVPGEEPADEVLPGTDREPVEVATGQVDRHDAGSFADDVRHAQTVAQRQPDRLAEPEDEDRPRWPGRTARSSTGGRRGRRRSRPRRRAGGRTSGRRPDRRTGGSRATPRTTGAHAPRASS